MLTKAFRFMLLCTTALAPGVVFASDDNEAFIDQIGADNEARIDQVGSANLVGLESDPVLQDAYYNAIIFSQTGNDNQIGTTGTGVDQVGQSTTPSVFNTIRVTQASDYNLVGEIYQAALGALPLGANRLSILQNLGDSNRIARVIQEQLDGMPGQIAEITQSGIENNIDLVEQRSLSPAQFSENTIRARFTGDRNGRVGLTGPALVMGVVDSALIQTVGYDGLGANGNQMDLEILGDFNRFGIFQGGRLNSVGLLTISGSGNQLGIRQDGLENDITASVISGDGNRVGLDQIGTNRAFLDVVGLSNDNDILGIQQGTNDLRFFVEGNRNLLTIEQDFEAGLGGTNDASIVVIGSYNFFDVLQRGDNIAEITVIGDSSNNSGTGFSGSAALGLDAGFVRQTGSGNRFSALITGDANLIAAAQTGDDNSIIALISGSANQAAVLQTGAYNVASLVQTGHGNTAGIIQ